MSINFSNKQKLILVVDDESNMCWILSKVLSRAGFVVESVSTGKEAITLVKNKKISAIIIDYRLPDMNGIELFYKLQRNGFLIPSILISSYGSQKLKQKSLKTGFIDYFDKPFSNKQLINVLKEHLKETV